MKQYSKRLLNCKKHTGHRFLCSTQFSQRALAHWKLGSTKDGNLQREVTPLIKQYYYYSAVEQLLLDLFDALSHCFVMYNG